MQNGVHAYCIPLHIVSQSLKARVFRREQFSGRASSVFLQTNDNNKTTSIILFLKIGDPLDWLVVEQSSSSH